MTSAIKNGKTLALRRPDACARCSIELEAGSQAVWFADSRTVECTSCVEGAVAEAERQPQPSESKAGASAQYEYERRAARELAKKQRAVEEDQAWRNRVKEERPVLGRLAALMTEKPTITPESQSTTAWKTGAEGERRVGERLDGLDEVIALHDLAVPNSRANIDHVAITPTGLYVVDAKKYKGEIESRNMGGFFKPDNRLYVRGRDRTKLVDGVLSQLDVVRAVMGSDLADLPMHAALCFVDGDFGLVPVHFSINSVSVLGLRKLSKTLQSPGPVDAERRGEVASLLRDRFRPAVT